ncbi:MAG: hypothetical protein EAX95_08835 [Candidatus Thorarchaeota archaeon]|nr:hypothetical protein [Candidatus Thorarchaeota archaeon]
MDSLSRRHLEGIIESSLNFASLKRVVTQETQQAVVGSMLQGVPLAEHEILNLAGARFGYRHVDFSSESPFTLSTEEVISKARMIGTCVDALVTGLIDKTSFGSGRDLTEKLSGAVHVPMISIMDDVYAPQPALAVLSAIWGELGSIQGRRIAVSWGYGSQLTPPNLAHSLLTLGAKLGAEMIVANPSEFPLMSRVIRNAERLAGEHKGHFDVINEFDISSMNADVVVGINWTRLDDYGYPDQVADIAREYTHWQFTKDILGSSSLFIAEPPIQTDLLASVDLIQSRTNLTPILLARRIGVLAQSIQYVIQCRDEGQPARII